MTTAIQWTNETWNPVVGCTKVSQGCKHCYAKTLHDRRHKAALAGKDVHPQYLQPFETVQLMPERLAAPLHWRKPRRVFVNSVSDLFHEDVPDAFLDRVFAVMALADWHVFQVLTKRAERMRDYFTAQWQPATNPPQAIGDDRHARIRGAVEELVYGASSSRFARDDFRGARWWTPDGKLRAFHRQWPLPNVWLGVSVEHQEAANERIPLLLQTPAAIRFLSCEPLLGALELTVWLEDEGYVDDQFVPPVDWVIVGGESGPGARVCSLQWIESIAAQCWEFGVPLFVKQLGARPVGEWGPNPPMCSVFTPGLGERDELSRYKNGVWRLTDRKGGGPNEWPERLRVRQFPGDEVPA